MCGCLDKAQASLAALPCFRDATAWQKYKKAVLRSVIRELGGTYRDERKP